MTITSAQIISRGRRPANGSSIAADRNAEKPPPKVYEVHDPPFRGAQPPQPDGYQQSKANPSGSAIVIDNGSHSVRAGWSFDKSPRFEFPPIFSRYRDRKANRTGTLVGLDAYVDATARGGIKNAFEVGTNIVTNWDVMEAVFDHIFVKLGVEGENGGIDRPVVVTEPIANLGYPRRMMNEILFECYSAPSVAVGIDSLFSYRYNGGTDGLVVSSGHTTTHVIPVLNSRPVLSGAARLNWGGWQATDYMMKLLKLKYPNFGRPSVDHMPDLVHNHCYVSTDYDQELGSYLDWTGLEDRDHVIQYPYSEHIVQEKTEEELARIAERKKESGRRLQEQAAKMRLEKLMKKEQELEYYKEIQQSLANETKKEIKRILDAEDMDDEAQLDKTIRELEKSIKRSRNKDVGGEEKDEAPEEATFPLLDVPDDQLDEAGLKEKRHQRLMKSNVEARQRAKAEKEKEKARQAEEERLDREKRENDFETWIKERRNNREALLERIKEKARMKADLGNRKSLHSQIRMRTIATLSSDGPKKRRRGGDDDTFGADDSDWNIYHKVQQESDDEEDDDPNAMLKSVEAELIKYDPDFTENDTLDAQSDWTNSLVHLFLRGPWPYNPESQRDINQIHLNVERIRVPEVVFQPSIAGIDQAGVAEIAADIVNLRFSSAEDQKKLLSDVFLTGGNTLFQGFDERLRTELRALLPVEALLNLRRASDPKYDAWKGAAQWASGSELVTSSLSRQEYLEKGSEYIKEHDLGNANL